MTPEAATDVCMKSPINTEGVCASFVRIDGTTGLKFYCKRHTRQFTYKLQRIFSTMGLAPKVGKKIKFKLNGNQYYGYITETVTETANSYHHGNCKIYPNDTSLPPWRRASWGRECVSSIAFKKMEEYIEKFKQHFFIGNIKPHDMNTGNVGWLPNGDFVAIDFSHFEYGDNRLFDWTDTRRR